jgi:pyrimidine-nucleoside phosphorylase
MELRIDNILESKRSGGILSTEQLDSFIGMLVANKISDAQAAAFCAFTMWHGMTPRETLDLTVSMANSGSRMRWGNVEATRIIDKHSTGGVGDKVSLILAPLWAVLGAKVPMVSARGAGYTGGTLDKLESIYGVQTQLPTEKLQQILSEVGCFIVGPNNTIAPADKILYRLRNETSTISSIPLIVSSILSKKLAEGITHLVLDVKYGCGTYMKTRTEAYHLAVAIETVSIQLGLDTRVVLSDMNQPLGNAVGNALEVEEAIECMKGGGPKDLIDLVCKLSGEEAARETLASGVVFEKFEQMILAQGGDLSKPYTDDSTRTLEVVAKRSGLVHSCDAYKIGYANMLLGGGRCSGQESIHHGVGIRLLQKKNAHIQTGDVLAHVFVSDEQDLDAALSLIHDAYTIV